MPVSKKPPGGPDKRSSNTAKHPLLRSNTKIIRDAVFGESDEELSDIEDEALPTVAPTKGSSRTKLDSNTTVVTRAVLKGRIVDSEDEIEAPSVSWDSLRKGPTKKKAALASDNEDDDDNLSERAVSNRNVSLTGQSTRVSALADRLEAAAARATHPTVDPNRAAMLTRESKLSLVSGDQKVSALDLNVSGKPSARILSRKISITRVALPTSDDSNLDSKVLQPAQEVQPAAQSERSNPPMDAFSSLYDTSRVAIGLENAGKSAVYPARTGLHLTLFWLMVSWRLECY